MDMSNTSNYNDDWEYNNEEEAEMGQLHAIHNNMNHVAAVQRKLAEQALQPSAKECQECGDEIPEARQKALLGVQHCVYCQQLKEKGRR
jgi:phage/conjugal plasmid C-4 type zinc finger TraR family protein